MNSLPRFVIMFSLLFSVLSAQEKMMTKRYPLTDILWLEPHPQIWKESWRFKDEAGKTMTQIDPFAGSGTPYKDEGGKTSWEVKEEFIGNLEHPQKLRNYLIRHTQVRFPEGSWISYNSETNSLTMKNLEAHHETLHSSLILYGQLALQIKITFRVIMMPSAEVDKLDRAHPEGIPDAKLISLWQSGRGKTIMSQSLKTINGVNAIIECVDEIIYPTSKLNPVAEGTPVSHRDLEIREIGGILNVTPTVDTRQEIIHLVILPEVAQKKEVDGRPSKPDDPTFPVFTSLNLATSAKLKNGSTHVIGRSTSRNPQQHVIVIISALLGDAESTTTLLESEVPQPTP